MAQDQDPLTIICETINFYEDEVLNNNMFLTVSSKDSSDASKKMVAEKLRKIFFTIGTCAQDCQEGELSYICVRYEKLSLDILHDKISFDEDVLELYENSVYILASWKDKLCKEVSIKGKNISLLSFFNEYKSSHRKSGGITLDLNCLIASKHAKAIKEMLEIANINISSIMLADNGIDAVRLAQKHRIDILLTEISLDRINGLVLSKRSFDKNNSVLVVYIDTNGYIPDFVKNRVIPYLCVLQEPLSPKVLDETFNEISDIINKKR